MDSISHVTRPHEFLGFPDDDDDLATYVDQLWRSGESRPEWCWLGMESGRAAHRVGFRVAPNISDPNRLGSLPPKEMFAFGCEGTDDPDRYRRFLVETLSRIHVPEGVAEIQTRLFLSKQPAAAGVAAQLRRAGFEVRIEKQGYRWRAGGPGTTHSDHVRLETIETAGHELFVDLVGRSVVATLDREMAYYRSHMSQKGWAAEMMSVLSLPTDTSLVAFVGGEPVGFITIQEFRRPEEGTIGYVGVVPEHRGHGYVVEIVKAGTGEAAKAGFSEILSDVDVLNHPMRAAMVEAGHQEAREWHVWSLYAPLERFMR